MTSDEEETLRTRWMEGVRLKEIGAELGRSAAAICRHAQCLGLPRRGRTVDMADRAAFQGMYARGLTITEVATRTGFHRDTVRKALVGSGVTIHDRTRKWPVRENAFTAPLTAEAWYWVGMLAADGCVRGPGISLVQHRSRAAMLRRFLVFVGSPQRPFRVTNRGMGYVADVSSPTMAADLARHGVVPRKSLTMKASEEAAAQPLFWLGVFDGDGCCTISKRGVPTIGIVGSHALMTQFATFLHRHLGDLRPAVGHAGASVFDVSASSQSVSAWSAPLATKAGQR